MKASAVDPSGVIHTAELICEVSFVVFRPKTGRVGSSVMPSPWETYTWCTSEEVARARLAEVGATGRIVKTLEPMAKAGLTDEQIAQVIPLLKSGKAMVMKMPPWTCQNQNCEGRRSGLKTVSVFRITTGAATVEAECTSCGEKTYS